MPASPLPRPILSSSRLWPVALLLLLAIFAAYANSLHGPFVYDDIPSITKNPTIRPTASLSDLLLPPIADGVTVGGRPMLNVSFAFNYAISGDEVWSYHALNILIHAGAALVLLGLIRRTLPRALALDRATTDALAFAITLLWALHPLQTQAVTYTVQRAESLMGLFYLLTLYAFARSIDAPPRFARNWQALSVVACLGGMATKEVMATAPLLVYLFDRTFVAGSFAVAWRARHRFYFGLAATWLLLGALVLSTGGNRGGSVGFGLGIPLWAYPLTQFEAVFRYLVLSVWPAPLVFEYGTTWVQRFDDMLPYAAIVLPLLGGCGFALWKKPVLGFLGAWFFLILAPSSLSPGTTQMIVEHRMYLPLAAVLAFFVIALHARLGRRLTVPLCALLALAFALLTVARHHDYRTALALWSDTLGKRPHNPRAHANLAEALIAAGRRAEAIAHYEAAVSLQPSAHEYHYNLGLALLETGQAARAIEQLEAALGFARDDANIQTNLAVALAATGDLPRALTHAQIAAHLAPRNASMRYNHALYLAATGHTDAAIPEYEAALRLNPDYPEAHNNLANALLQLNRPAEAVPHYETGLRLRPASPEAHSNLGVALFRLGRTAEAAPHFEAVLRALPDDVTAHKRLGQIDLAAGHSSAAIAHFESALRTKPDSVETLTDLGRACAQTDRLNDAIALYERALHLDPRAVGTRYNLANALFQRGDFAAAARAYEEVMRAQPENNDARFNLAATLVRLNRITDAVAAYEEILRSAPADATAHAELANLLAHLGRTAEAIAHFETALRLQPEFPAARTALDNLRRVSPR